MAQIGFWPASESRYGPGVVILGSACRARRRAPALLGQPAAAAGAAAAAASPPAGSSQPASRSHRRSSARGINFVRVDVIVTRQERQRRSPICKQSDFEVTEDGKPQKIETFKLVKLDGGVLGRRSRAAAADPHRLRRGDRKRRATTCGCSRSSSTTTTSGAAPSMAVAQADLALHRERSSGRPT